ncbi:hypothetical protein DFH08DRAFT_826961 [Mycena albidolilacea]|uniref:DUF6532 domain-containing protein n=1 Tax=Mycena albidolilacea TaxID=1033008 RepID=A0AAD7E7T4_9AGAR|nr:hypothetical protein DFH08DRAFT_826961 [Mycena albidolilacea]
MSTTVSFFHPLTALSVEKQVHAVGPDTKAIKPTTSTYCANKVKDLPTEGNFLNSGSAHNENMNHPALGMCLCKVIYNGKFSLTASFKDLVPWNAVGLIGTIYNCLKEMETGQLHKISFSAEASEGCCNKVLGSIEGVLNVAKYKQQLKKWARVKGQSLLGKRLKHTGGQHMGIKLNLLRPGH